MVSSRGISSLMSMGFTSIEDPLVVPDEPMRVLPGQFHTPKDLACEWVALIKRAFKAEELYYE